MSVSICKPGSIRAASASASSQVLVALPSHRSGCNQPTAALPGPTSHCRRRIGYQHSGLGTDNVNGLVKTPPPGSNWSKRTSREPRNLEDLSRGEQLRPITRQFVFGLLINKIEPDDASQQTNCKYPWEDFPNITIYSPALRITPVPQARTAAGLCSATIDRSPGDCSRSDLNYRPGKFRVASH